MKTEKEMIKLINENYPQMNAVPLSDFYSGDTVTGIWFRQEGALIDGWRVHDEFHHDTKYERYEITVLKVFDDFLKMNGWYAQPYDAGTLFAYPIC